MRIRVTLLVGLGLLITGLVAFVVLRPDATELDGSDTVPIFTAVVEHEESYSSNARLVISLEPGQALLSSGADGRVTEVVTEPGDLVLTGSVVARVNGISVVTVHTRTPFWRTLDRSSQGEDVGQLQCALKELGLYEGACDGTFGAATTVAVREFNEGIGRGRVADLDHRFLIWLPTEQLLVGALMLEAGAWFPSRGAPILEAAPTVSAARVETGALNRFDLERFSPFVFQATGTQLEIPVSDTLSMAIDDLGPLADELVRGAQASAEDEGIPGELRGSRTYRSLAVPTVAIVETSNAFCVYVQDGEDFTAVSVAPTGSSVAGATFLEAELRVGSQIVVNPREMNMKTC